MRSASPTRAYTHTHARGTSTVWTRARPPLLVCLVMCTSTRVRSHSRCVQAVVILLCCFCCCAISHVSPATSSAVAEELFWRGEEGEEAGEEGEEAGDRWRNIQYSHFTYNSHAVVNFNTDTSHSINLDCEEGAASTIYGAKRRSDEADDEVHHPVSDGMCLSVFLLLVHCISGDYCSVCYLVLASSPADLKPLCQRPYFWQRVV